MSPNRLMQPSRWRSSPRYPRANELLGESGRSLPGDEANHWGDDVPRSTEPLGRGDPLPARVNVSEVAVVFLGVDWAEEHHDVCLLDEQGKVLGRARVANSLEGVSRIHALRSEE